MAKKKKGAKKKTAKKTKAGGKKQSKVDVIKVLSQLLVDATAKAVPKEDTGACVYVAGSKTYCAVLTKASCDVLKGAWTKDGKCP